SEGWSLCLKAMQDHDRRLVAGWNNEIDTMLIFAGLFSAVLTAFLLESMDQLEPDTDQLTVQLLAQISSQLQNLSLRSDVPDATTPAMNPLSADFHAAPSAIRINILWFTSLVFSLSTALFASIVRQWLREFDSAKESLSLMESIRLR
ncbi:hypothetical protein PUNSTDRAFT_26629, partial [Punctularia strigosozonata HHB-11173 SS5]|uniref:uncharacterized protein n=1 Tax=Punctularia strigosozonata (strain HHB-11173) TaxID=741275 RepID=UPI0004418062